LPKNLLDVESTSGRFGDLEDPLAGRANQFPCNVDHLSPKSPPVGGEGNPRFGVLFFFLGSSFLGLKPIFFERLLEIEGPERLKALSTARVEGHVGKEVLERHPFGQWVLQRLVSIVRAG
jgi:hypothetical protein